MAAEQVERQTKVPVAGRHACMPLGCCCWRFANVVFFSTLLCPQGEDIYGAGSILSPALAKNVITVGASEASPSSAGLADDLNEVCQRRRRGAQTNHS